MDNIDTFYFYPKFATKFNNFGTGKLCFTIRDDESKKLEATCDFSANRSDNPLCYNLGNNIRLYPPCEIFDSYNQEFQPPMCQREYNVHPH